MPTHNAEMSNAERLSAYTAERDRLMGLSEHEAWRKRDETDLVSPPRFSGLKRQLWSTILVVGLVSGLAGTFLGRAWTSQPDSRWASVDSKIGELERQISSASSQLSESKENERRLEKLIEVMLRSPTITDDQRASLVSLLPPTSPPEPPPAP